MIVTADIDAGKLLVDGAVFGVSNKVRTLLDGTRKSCEVIRSIPDNLPYDPRPFPKGLWNITGIEWQKEKGFDPRTYGPVKIRTDAWQTVKAWALDKEGDYFRETEESVPDSGYLLHYSVFATTLGCIRIGSPADAETIARILQAALRKGEEVKVKVV